MIIPDMSEREYHGRQELSSTGARRLLESPARFRYMQDHGQPHSDAFDLGSAVHAKVLGVGWGIEEMDFPDWRTKAARDARDAAREAGLIPMLSKDLEPVHAMTEAVLAHPTARALFELPGGREVSVFSEVDGVPVRARFDALTDPTPQGRFGIDLKTTMGRASGDEFTRSVAKYGYDVQEAHYLDTFEASEAESLNFVYVVVEKDPPHLVAVHRISELWRDMGRTKAKRAREIYARCVETGEWPGYPEDVQELAPPTWLVIEHEEQYELEAF